jgi:predicted phage replisome organizer
MPEIKWIKITTDMFDDDKIKLIEKMPDADTLLIIWIKLICLAGKVNQNGCIYLAEGLPYNEEELSIILNRPVNTIRLALKLFQKYLMIEIQEQTGYIILINWERHQNIEALERIRESNRRRVIKFREHQKQLTLGNVTVTFGNATDKIRVDKSREDIDENNELFKKLLDEKKYDEVIIDGQKLSSIIKCLTGEYPCSATNQRIYKESLDKLGINLKDIGVDS